MIKHYQIRNLYPLVGTIISIVLFVIYWNNGFNKFLAIIITFFGLMIWWTASITLGKSFSITPKASELIQTGIYSKIRHPIYVGFSITGIGLAILTHSNLLILLSILAVLSSFIRANLEEKKLVEKFGEKYLNYKKSTWF
ncbi:MAG: isoprenylcysteine carboxylmethyltransferase family protein [Nanoarchaeota archaeon]|nr:isoprenylcysteine carboxylmethyltransferase family protein [Nanoarchaeota archaeon]